MFENLVRNLIFGLIEPMDVWLDKVRLESNEVTKSTHSLGVRVESLDKKMRELDKYARDCCENQPFIRVENLAKI